MDKENIINYDRFLSKFKKNNNKCNFLEISYSNNSLLHWFINNISNKNSIYTIVNEKDILINEDFLKSNIKVINQNILDILYIYDKKYENYFDVIFLNSNFITDDILSIFIISNKILKYNGFLIYDNFNFSSDKQKLSIDNFIKINNDKIEVLLIDKLIFLKKKNVNIKLPTKIKKIISKIKNYKQEDNIILFPPKKKEKLNLDLIITKKKPLKYLTTENKYFNKIEKYKKFLDKESKKNKDFFNEYNLCEIQLFFYNYKNDFKKLFENFYDKILDKIRFYNFYKYIDFYYRFSEKKISFRTLEIVSNIKFPNKKKIRYFHVLHSLNPSLKKKNILIKGTYDEFKNQMEKRKYHNVEQSFLYIPHEYPNNNNSTFNNNILRIDSDIKNSKDIKFIKNKLKNKIDYLFLSLVYKTIYYQKYPKDSFYLQSLLNTIILALSTQSIGGSAVFFTVSLFDYVNLDLIEILRNYYEKVELINLSYENKKTVNYYIRAHHFRGIDLKELNKLYDISDTLYLKNKNIGREIDNIYFVKSILKKTDKQKKELNKLKKYVIHYNNTILKNADKKYSLHIDIYKNLFKNKNKRYDLLIKEVLLKKQLEEYINFMIKIDINLIQ